MLDSLLLDWALAACALAPLAVLAEGFALAFVALALSVRFAEEAAEEALDALLEARLLPLGSPASAFGFLLTFDAVLFPAALAVVDFEVEAFGFAFDLDAVAFFELDLDARSDFLVATSFLSVLVRTCLDSHDGTQALSLKRAPTKLRHVNKFRERWMPDGEFRVA